MVKRIRKLNRIICTCKRTYFFNRHSKPYKRTGLVFTEISVLGWLDYSDWMVFHGMVYNELVFATKQIGACFACGMVMYFASVNCTETLCYTPLLYTTRSGRLHSLTVNQVMNIYSNGTYQVQLIFNFIRFRFSQRNCHYFVFAKKKSGVPPFAS